MVHALGKVVEGSKPSAAASILTETVSGLATDSLSKAVAHFKKDKKSWSSVNIDLDRVVTHALLTILHETLAGNGHGAQAADLVREAENAWQLRIFSASDLTQDQIIHLLRTPATLGPADADEIAGQMLTPIHQQGISEIYAAAVEQRFAETFEVLLRQDERAFRAATILLNRKSFLELAAIRSDLAALAEMVTKPQPVLRRFPELEKTTTSIQTTDFQFKRRATAYRVREEKEAQLMQWLLHPQRFGIAKVTGAAAMGKSRPALQICDWCYHQHWLAGFVDTDDKLDWERWTPILDTVIVVDYVGSKAIGNRSAFRWLESLFLRLGKGNQRANGSTSRVRIILIDRTDKGPFWTDWSQSELARDLDEIVLPVPLEPDREEFDAILRSELQRRLVRDPSQAEPKILQALADRLNGQFRPLFALLAAAAIADPDIPSSQVWSPEILTSARNQRCGSSWRKRSITRQS